jgi:hypothetical protein
VTALDRPNVALADRYRLERELGAGGMRLQSRTVRWQLATTSRAPGVLQFRRPAVVAPGQLATSAQVSATRRLTTPAFDP